MGTVSSLIIGGLAIAAAVGCYLFTRSILISFLIVIVVYLIGKNLQPFFSQWWMRVSAGRLPQLYEFRAKKMPATGERLGFRLIAMTEFMEPGPQTVPLYREMAEAALEALSKESELFALRLNAVRGNDDPEQFVCALCGKDGKKMRKCLKAWVRSAALRNMQSQTQNRDLFLYDGAINVAGQADAAPYTVLVLFDSSLPVKAPKSDEAPPEDAKPEGGDA